MSVLKILCALILSTATVQADWNNQIENESILVAQNLTLDEAARRLKQQINGRVLRAETIQQDGKNYYLFKVLTEDDGRVRLIKVDPETGQSIGNQ